MLKALIEIVDKEKSLMVKINVRPCILRPVVNNINVLTGKKVYSDTKNSRILI